MKMETATVISYTSLTTSTLTLVCDPTFNGPIKLDGVSYTTSGGIVIIPSVAAGAHTITKGNTTNLFYIKTEYTLSLDQNPIQQKLVLFPNPVTNTLNIAASDTEVIQKVAVYNLIGQQVKNILGDIRSIDMNDLINGTYFVKVQTDHGVFNGKIIKK